MTSHTEILRWTEQLPFGLPLRPESHADQAGELRQWIHQHPDISGSVLEALLWVRIGEIDPAHRIVQEATQGLAAYVHGVIHRMEGDYWNAKYWFRQVRDPGLAEAIREALRAPPIPEPWRTDFTPTAFVDACENVRSHAFELPDALEALRQVALVEWESLCQAALRKGSAGNAR
jgi:hypothetical protein